MTIASRVSAARRFAKGSSTRTAVLGFLLLVVPAAGNLWRRRIQGVYVRTGARGRVNFSVCVCACVTLGRKEHYWDYGVFALSARISEASAIRFDGGKKHGMAQHGVAWSGCVILVSCHW